jgi:flagellar protein FliS
MDSHDARARFLRDRVLTATPAQRIVMLYDRLARDLTQAETEPDAAIAHAMQIVAELQSSLDVTAGGAAENLVSVYAHMLRELIAVRGGEPDRLSGVSAIVSSLRESWAQVAEETGTAPASDGGAPDAAPRLIAVG